MKKLCAALSILLLWACASGPKSQKLTVGMTRVQVVQKFGSPEDSIATKMIPGGTVSVLQYELLLDLKKGVQPYYLYFFDGQLVDWGPPGDWEAEADRVFKKTVG